MQFVSLMRSVSWPFTARRLLMVLAVLAITAASCGSAEAPSAETDAAAPQTELTSETDEPAPAEPAAPAATPLPLEGLPTGEPRDFGPAPDIPTGDLDPAVAAAVDIAFGERLLNRDLGEETFTAIRELGSSEDPRVAWLLTDLLRVATSPDLSAVISGSLSELLGVGVDPFNAWGNSVDHLIAWDVPAPPDYLTYKRNAYVIVEPRWDRIFVEDSDVDWRLVSWGGVWMDDRPYDETDAPCQRCIPAIDNPRTTDIAGGDEWLDDDTIVFGVVVNDQARAYPRSIMEVREMVNDTLGGRDFAMPYCTLCGSAQVFFTDQVPDEFERPILRTSGLLSRSNKVMFDLRTSSVFDTFLGAAVTGPLFDAGVSFEQNSVITTTWAQWKQEHPDTDVLAIEEALGRPYNDFRSGRDADGPIFPIGDVDARLPVHEDILGIVTDDGTPVAFHVASAINRLERGESIALDGINIVLDGGGVKAVDDDGEDLGAHQAFWFAWSQFHPETELWPEA